MTARTVAAIACLIVGVGLAAWSLASGQLPLAIIGFALIFTFLYLVMEAANKAGKPKHQDQALLPTLRGALKDEAGANDRRGQAVSRARIGRRRATY